MIGDNGGKDDTELEVEALEDEDLDEEDLDEDAMPDIGGETVIDVARELEAELVAEYKRTDPDEAARKREIRKRLEELAEMRNIDLDDTFNFDLDDDEV
jgi:hypothetical protein